MLRVHAISGIMDYYDYAPAATGMTYYDELNTGGVTVDGVPDTIVPGEFIWMMVTGAQGTMVHSVLLDTDIPGFDYSSYYSDDSTPSVTQCTGDAYEYGANGLWEEDPVPNTDPALGAYNIFETVRVLSYGPENEDPGFAVARADEALSPLVAAAFPYEPDTTASISTEIPGGAYGTLLLEVSPNPARGVLLIRFTQDAPRGIKVDLHDVAGRRVKSLSGGAHGGGHIEADVSDLAAGIYFVRVPGPGGVSGVRKVVVVR